MSIIKRVLSARLKNLFAGLTSIIFALTVFTGVSFADFTIFHVNDTHARVTPHKMIVPAHGATNGTFEDVGGAAYLAGKMLQLTAGNPNALVIDAGDISEGNPIGDMGGNGSMTQFYALLSGKLKAQRGRGMDAVVVGNHDVRDVNYINNLDTLKNSGVPVISVNVRDVATHQPHFAPYNIVTINGVKIGLLGYTTSASEVGASLAGTLEVATCDWHSNNSSNVHLADYVNDLRNNQGCAIVILVAHIGHSSLVDPAAPLLVDDGYATLPEVVVSGHWHTWADTVWQPEMLNDKTIFTESASYMKYIGELQISNTGGYVSATQHVIRDVDIIPDPDVQTLVNNLTAQYNAMPIHTGHPVDEVIGYTNDNLMLDNVMKWWSVEEYPWSGNNTAGQWICDAMRWKAEQLFGQCDLSFETGGGVRADIPAGPVTYLQVYETFPWSDDTFSRVNMTGQEIFNFLKTTNMDAGFSSALKVTANDGVPSSVQFNACAAQDTPCWQPIDLAHTYTVAISNYMYVHPPTGWSWTDLAPLNSGVLCREGIADYMRQQHPDQAHAYTVGGPRYNLNTEFSGGYRAVVTMMNDNDSKPTYEDAFIRFLSATPETVARRGTPQVPVDLVNADGTINAANRLSEGELYRSYLGFKTGVLVPGDIIETWGKGSFYGGNPEFVDQEGVYSDKKEFKIVGHDDSLAKPVFVSSINAFWNDNYKNHYVQFLGKKTSTSTVVDQNGASITINDVTGYAAKTLPGNTNDMLLISGVPTMESFGMRFRCNNAVVSSAIFPSTTGPSSHVGAVSAGTTSTPLTLSASASVGASVFSLSPAADAQVASGKPTTNYNTTNLYVQSSSTSTYGNERSWLKFDLSSIPSNATITGATLQLYEFLNSATALLAEVRGGSDDSWTETGITWNTQPAFGDVLASQNLAANTRYIWYNWDVTPFTQSKWSGNKLVSLLVKAATESSSTTTTFAFDSKEYSGTRPVLQVTTTGGTATITQVQYFYRYSADNTTWGSWTSAGSVSTAPYTLSFNYPQGTGYYEFYSRATDSNSNVEPAPPSAQAFTHYTASPAYYPTLSLDNLYQRYDGSPKTAGVTTIPAGTSYSVTYDGNSAPPVYPGIYWVAATTSQGGNTVTNAATLTIGKGAATVNIGNWSFTYDGSSKSATASTTPSGFTVSTTYNGSFTAPVNAGTYNLVATIMDSNYQGSATGTLVITPATATVTLGNLNFTYDGTAKNVTVTTNPASLPVTVTYNGSTTPPSVAGTYTVVATISNPNYQGSATGTMTISDTTASPVPALGPWGILVAAVLLGGVSLRRRARKM